MMIGWHCRLKTGFPRRTRASPYSIHVERICAPTPSHVTVLPRATQTERQGSRTHSPARNSRSFERLMASAAGLPPSHGLQQVLRARVSHVECHASIDDVDARLR